jgi:O-antigen/teichoic acid export membrane protein
VSFPCSNYTTNFKYVWLVFIAGQEMRLATVAILASQISRTGFLLLSAIFFGTVGSLISAAILHGVLQTLLLLGYLGIRFPRFWLSFDPRFLRAQLSYALPLGVAGLVHVFQFDLHNYFVSARFGPAAFAVYAVGCFQLPLVQLLSDAAGGVLIPKIAELQRLGDTDGIISVSLRAARKLSVVILPAYAFLLVTAREFINFLFTPQYASSRPIFMVNLTMMPLSLILLDPIVRAYAEYRYKLLQFHVLLAVPLIGGLWWATGRFGMLGAISVAVAVTALERSVKILVAVRVLHFRRIHLGLLGDTGKLALSAGLAALAAGVVRSMLSASAPVVVLLACGLVFACAYIALVFALGVPTPEEIAQVRRFLSVVASGRVRRGAVVSPGR